MKPGRADTQGEPKPPGPAAAEPSHMLLNTVNEPDGALPQSAVGGHPQEIQARGRAIVPEAAAGKNMPERRLCATEEFEKELARGQLLPIITR
jgi:hypothetical protein